MSADDAEGALLAVQHLYDLGHRHIAHIDALDDAGLTVPAKASVVGYDNTAFAALNHIGLTTIDQPRNQMGRVAATMLLGALSGTTDLKHIHMRPQLVVRSTTGSWHAQE